MTKSLLELAREATPGPWTVTDNSWEVSTIYGSDRKAVAECHIDPEVTEDNQATLEKVTAANAAFIAAANPQRIIELCEAIEKLIRSIEVHAHVAFVNEPDTCAKCGQNFRASVHRREGEPSDVVQQREAIAFARRALKGE